MRVTIDQIYKIDEVSLPFGIAYNLIADVKKNRKPYKNINISVSHDEFRASMKNEYYDT